MYNMTLLLSHPCMLDHGIPMHPENRTRLEAIYEALENSPYKKNLDLTCTRMATADELAMIHDKAYIDFVMSLAGKDVFIDPETPLTKGSVKAALLAAGYGMELVERVLDGKIKNGFLLARPPGHHAEADHAMGFCVFNNIAVAAKKALSRGLKRILIIDWDVHCGNGTQHSFYDDDRVLVVDFHQQNLFPQGSGLLEQIGEGKGSGYTVNIPLPEASGDDDYLYIFDNIVDPLAKHFKPELILVSAGFDAHESDPLASMCLTTSGFSMLTAKVKALAKELCHDRLVLFLEGGYNPPYLAENVLACTHALIEQVEAPKTESPLSYGIDTYSQELYDIHLAKRLT